MKLETRNFGEIEIMIEDVINFKEGLPGFPDNKQFVILTQDESPVSFLQCVDDGDVSFVVVDMLAFMPDYNPSVDANHIANLGTYDPANFLIFNIATIFDNLSESTVNLKAPIVVNITDKLGKQVVCENDEYSVKAPLFAEAAIEDENDLPQQDEEVETC